MFAQSSVIRVSHRRH